MANNVTRLQAKMHLGEITDYGSQKKAVLRAVYSSNPDHPNYVWSLYTPAGELSLTITNPAAADFFEFDTDYLITIEPSLPDAPKEA